MESQIEQQWNRLQEKVARLAHDAGRNPADITIVGVTKGQPVEAIEQLVQAGCHHIRENRVQEATLKKPLLPANLTWHLIGSLQTNKLAKALSLFDLIHSVDRPQLATLIPPTTPILLQVNISGEAGKQGWSAEGLLAQFESIHHLNIHGLMTIAPAHATVKELSTYFGGLRRLRDQLATPLQASSSPVHGHVERFCSRNRRGSHPASNRVGAI